MFKKYLRKISDNVYHGHITDFAILDIVKNSTFNLELYLDGNHFHLGRHNAFNLVKKFMRDKQKAEVYLIEGPVMKISDLLEMPQISKSSLDHYYDEKINSKNFELTKNMILLGSKDGYDHYHMSDTLHSDDGKNYWKRIINHYKVTMTIGYMINAELYTINDHTNLDSLWGDTDEFADIQLFITKKEI
jgi:hypothetical protein